MTHAHEFPRTPEPIVDPKRCGTPYRRKSLKGRVARLQTLSDPKHVYAVQPGEPGGAIWQAFYPDIP